MLSGELWLLGRLCLVLSGDRLLCNRLLCGRSSPGLLVRLGVGSLAAVILSSRLILHVGMLRLARARWLGRLLPRVRWMHHAGTSRLHRNCRNLRMARGA